MTVTTPAILAMKTHDLQGDGSHAQPLPRLQPSKINDAQSQADHSHLPNFVNKATNMPREVLGVCGSRDSTSIRNSLCKASSNAPRSGMMYSWEYIFAALPSQSEGTIRVRCSTKLKRGPRLGAGRSGTGGGANCFVDVGAPATETIEPSSSGDDDDSSDRDPDFSSDNGDSSEEKKWSYVQRREDRVDTLYQAGRSGYTVPVTIKGETVTSSTTAKILGVVVDAELLHKQHIANAATKGLRAAMALRRLRMVSPSTARQVYGAMVV